MSNANLLPGLRRLCANLRGRDFRALAFSFVLILGVLGAALVVFDSWPPALLAGGGAAFLILNHPRLVRVRRRLGGDKGHDWSDYYRD